MKMHVGKCIWITCKTAKLDSRLWDNSGADILAKWTITIAGAAALGAADR